MPLNANEEALLGKPSAEELDYEHQRLENSPEERSKIGKWTVVALILNRTIGSGIFLTPHKVLGGTGCVGGALFLWAAGALISLCGLYVWLECGLSMPQRRVRGEAEPRGVPRSGGEKNFLEFMFPNAGHRLPHIRTTCTFGIMFILMYNLSGNAMAFASQVLTASGAEATRGPVLGIAIGVLSLIILLHTFSRRGGLLINNGFAILKVGLLLTIIALAIAKVAGRFGTPGQVIPNNFTSDVWVTQRSDVSSWSRSLTLCMYAFWGFEQPFYVLSECKSPRRYFPRYTVLALITTIVLYMLVNVSYLLVVDKSRVLPLPGDAFDSSDLATLFFDSLFGENHDKGARAMAAVIAVSIFGNLWVMTFTAARVKQEIAKEGILPWSLQIATSYRTPYGLCKKWLSKKDIPDEEVERAPTAAFALHWCTSILLVILVAPISTVSNAYTGLVQLYTYTIIALLGAWVSVGLIRTKLHKAKWYWQERRRYRPWLSPIHVIVFGLSTAFMLVAAFVPPEHGSPFHETATHMKWYIVPIVGITGPFWGILWYWGLLAYEWKIGRHLVVSREAYWMPDPDYAGEYIQQAEIIDHSWQITLRSGMAEDFAEVKSSFVIRQRDLGSDGSSLERARPARYTDDGDRRPMASARRLSDSFDS